MKRLVLTLVIILSAITSIKAQGYFVFSEQRTKEFLRREDSKGGNDYFKCHVLKIKNDTIINIDYNPQNFNLTTYTGTAQYIKLIELYDTERKFYHEIHKFRDIKTGIIFEFYTFDIYNIADDSIQIANRSKVKKLGFKVYRDFTICREPYQTELIVTKYGNIKLLDDVITSVNKGKGVSYINQLALTKKQYLAICKQADSPIRKLANLLLQYQSGTISRYEVNKAKPIVATLKKLSKKLNAINVDKFSYKGEIYFFYHLKYEKIYYNRDTLSEMLEQASYALGMYY